MLDTSKFPTPEPLMETLQQVEAFESTPLSEQFPFTDSYQIIMHSAQRFSEDIALEFLLQGLPDEPTRQVSFHELGAQITGVANLLNSLGLTQADSTSIILPILPETHFAIWGAQAAGIANPINPMLEAEHIGEIINAAGSRVVICLAPSAHSDIWDKVSDAVGHCPSVTHLIAVNIPGLCQAGAPALTAEGITLLDFHEAVDASEQGSLASRRQFSGDDIAAYFHTGGTTGRPKLAQLTHGNMAFLGQLMQLYTAHMERHSVLCGLPLFHIYGCIIQGVAAFAVGYRVILMTPAGFRSPQAMQHFWQHIDRFKVKSFAAVPTVLMALSDIPVGDADISGLTNINSGAAPLSVPFEQGFEKNFEVNVSNGYGMTETTALISRAPEQQPPHSVGMRIPYSQIRIAILNGDKIERDCELGESGVVLVKGPQVFAGYKTEADNTNAWIEDGWFNTGDLGYLDENAFLYLSGRAKDLIIRSGHNIDPELIEEPLNSHPAVSASIAIGLPDPFAGELPMAYVVKAPSQDVSEKELIEYCSTRISERAAIPKRIEFIDAMPLTAVGKIFRPALRQRIAEEVINGVLADAGIEGEVSSGQEKKRGMVLSIALKDSTTEDKVKELTKGYTFPIDIS